MSKKRIIILFVAILVVVGGVWGIKTYLDTTAHNTYVASADYKADQLLGDLTTGNYQDAYDNLFSESLKAAYSLSYWKSTDDIFPLLKGYKATPKLVSKQPANEVDSNQPKPYTDDVHAEQYVYDFEVNSLTYRVTFVVISLHDVWQINEIRGWYQK